MSDPVGRLRGRVAVVTGAGRGMGAAHAAALAGEGATVVATDVRDAPVVHDVTSEDSWAALVEQVLTAHGRLDVLVNNAGVAGGIRPLLDTPLEHFRWVCAVNQEGVFLGMKHVAPAMAAGGGGSIVNISSVSGLLGQPGQIAYNASKFAVTGMTKAAAIELGRLGIRVNSVHPGGIDTPMLDVANAGIDVRRLPYDRLPVGRLGRPEEVARLVVFLASDDSSYCTGAEFVIDGGQTCALSFPLR